MYKYVYTTGDGGLIYVGPQPDGFVGVVAKDAQYVHRPARVLWTQRNRKLISYTLTNAAGVEVGRPCGVDWDAYERGEIARFIKKIARTEDATSRGGFRRVADWERLFFELAAHYDRDEPLGATLFSRCCDNPLFVAVHLWVPCEVEPWARVVAAIGDPRFYTDKTNPGSSRRLRRHLGLADGARGRRTARAAAVRRLWSSTVHNVFCEMRTLAVARACDDPDGATSRYFVRFLRDLWLDLAHVLNGGDARVMLFDPTDYGDPAATARWREFRKIASHYLP